MPMKTTPEQWAAHEKWLAERKRKAEEAGLPPMERAERDEYGNVVVPKVSKPL